MLKSVNDRSIINSKLKSAGELVVTLGKVIQEKDKLLFSTIETENNSKADIVDLKFINAQKD